MVYVRNFKYLTEQEIEESEWPDNGDDKCYVFLLPDGFIVYFKDGMLK